MKNHSPLFCSLSESSSFHRERNDCTVKALAIAGDLTYGVAHTMMAKRGRRPRNGAFYAHVFDALKEIGKTVDEVTKYEAFKDIKTIKSLQDLRLNGCYIIRVSGHMLAMKDGIIHDWTNNRLHRIKSIHRVV